MPDILCDRCQAEEDAGPLAEITYFIPVKTSDQIPTDRVYVLSYAKQWTPDRGEQIVVGYYATLRVSKTQ